MKPDGYCCEAVYGKRLKIQHEDETNDLCAPHQSMPQVPVSI